MGIVTSSNFRMAKGLSSRRVCSQASVLRRLPVARNACRAFNRSSLLNINQPSKSTTGCNPAPTSPPHFPPGIAAGPASSITPHINRKWKKTSAAAFDGSFFSQSSPALLRTPPVISSLPHVMAAYAYSTTSSSDISTPRSISPASVLSGRSSQSSVSNKRMSISSRRMSHLNPMSSVDIQAIEDSMKMASLDTMRGYAQNHYGQVQQYTKTEHISHNQAAGHQVLREPLWNKGELLLRNRKPVPA